MKKAVTLLLLLAAVAACSSPADTSATSPAAPSAAPAPAAPAPVAAPTPPPAPAPLDFSQVKEGMPVKKLLALVGEPATKAPWVVGEVWMYQNPGQVILVNDGAVVNSRTKAKWDKDMADIQAIAKKYQR